MPAMTMPFVVLEKDAALLQRVGPGDEVTATLVAPDSRYWLEDLVVVKKGTPDPSATPGPRAHEPHPGDAMPDVALVDQDGKALRLADYRGKSVALTFVFTRCPLPDFCPLMMKKFAAAHATLAGDPGLAARTRLLTISFDTDARHPGRPAGLREALPEDDARPSRTGRSPPGRTRRSARSGGRSSSTTSRRAAPSPTTSAPPCSTAKGSSAGSSAATSGRRRSSSPS